MHLENISPFETKLVLIVGNLAQLPPIYRHTIRNDDILCKSCHIKFAPCWKTTKQYFLSISMNHGTNFEYLQFLNIIQERKPTTKEIQTILSQCFLNKIYIYFEMDTTTTIFCIHNTYVEKYNNMMLQKQFSIT